MRKFRIQYSEWVLDVFYITDVEEAKAVVSKKLMDYDTFGCDIETGKKSDVAELKRAGLDPHMSFPRLLQLYGGDDRIYVFDCLNINLNIFKEILETKKLIGHNSVFEMKFFAHAGLKVPPMHCTQIMGELVYRAEDEERVDSPRMELSLECMTRREFGYQIPKDQQTSNWNNAKLSIQQIQYAALDAVLTYKLAYEKFLPRIREYNLARAYNLTIGAQSAVVDMELTGIQIDLEAHTDFIDHCREEMGKMEIDVIAGMPGVTNLGSPGQLSTWAANHLDEKTLKKFKKTKTGQYSFDQKGLAAVKHIPSIQKYLAYKKFKTMDNSFGDNFTKHISPVTNRIHPTFWLTGQVTGRMSSSNPNFQNRPRDKKFRKLITAQEGNLLIGADYSQIETRIQAECSQDPVMLDAYRNGRDLYRVMATRIFNKEYAEIGKESEERQLSKACFSGDTEVLTREGWVRLDQYDGISEVAQYKIPAYVQVNQKHSIKCRYGFAYPNTEWDCRGSISFTKPTGVVSHPDKEVWRLHNGKVDVAATPDHRILHVNAYNQAQVQCFEDCTHVKSFVRSGYYNNAPELSDKWTRILSMFVADGSRGAVGLQFRFGFVKRRKIRRCLQLLRDVGIFASQKTKPANTSTGKVTTISFRSEYLDGVVASFTDGSKGLLWSCIDRLPMKTYLEEAAYWDGHIRRAGNHRTCLFSTTSKQTADVMQAMVHLSGGVCRLTEIPPKRTGCSTQYALAYSNKEVLISDVRNADRNTEYSTEQVYCLAVPSGYLLIRRNGKICVQGNCLLALGYGMGWRKFQATVFENSGTVLDDGRSHFLWKQYHEIFKEYSAWCDAIRFLAERTGYAKTRAGRLRKLHINKQYTHAPNTYIQGSAAQVMFYAMADIMAKNLKGFHLIAVIHDEFLCTAPEDLAPGYVRELEDSMTTGYLKVFPDGITNGIVEAKTGKTWASVH